MAKNVSNLFKEVIRNGGPFYCYADFVLSDGTVLALDSENDFCIDGNNYEESGGSGFPLGVALSKSINVGILNTDDRFSAYDFYMAKITLYTEADLSDGTKERIKEGTFTVTSPTANGELIELVAYDDMYKTDKEYAPTITFPNTALRTLRDVCTVCDIVLGMAEFENSDYQIDAMPEDLTCRQVIGYIAMIALGNAMFDVNNRLVIKTYDFSLFETVPIVSGGTLSDDLQDSYSGGTFGETVKNYISGGEFGTLSNFHILSEFSTDPDICTDDVVITGIRMDVEDEEGNTNYILYGTRDYALNIDNDLVAGKEEDFTKMVGDKLIGVVIRPFSGTFLPDPTVEFMDCVYVIDRKDNIYQSFICNHSFEYLGNSTFSNEMESPARNDSAYQSSATEAYRKAREQVKKNRTEWEKAMDELSDRVNNSAGLYMTKEGQEDSSYIYYMHDKPTLEESMIVWKMTAEAFAVSNDGGNTYTAGLTVDGTLIAKIMNTIGINFDWGIGGTLVIEDSDGNEVVYMDADTGTVRMKVDSLSIGGKTTQEIAEEQLNDFVDSVYSPAISNLQAQIDGQIETYYYDYEPTLSNIPASEWTTDTEKQKHEGDLFYWKSKGYAYRFFKDGNTWKWQMVQDTDITKALEQAATAQDTADQKRRVFVSTPTPPYDVGDLWAQGTKGDIMRCQTARQTGNYNSSDWIKASKYTDNTALTEFINGDFQNSIDDLKEQADQKAETWYQSTDPSTAWTTTAVKNEHIGDIWYNTSSIVQKSYRWNGTSWQEMKSTPPDAVFDEIDGKAQIFISAPKPPYHQGDLWFNSTTSDIMTCIQDRESGNYTASDWQKRNKYTDDSAVDNLDESLDQEEVFNRLTNNGAMNGLYMRSNQLYVNASYIRSGTLVLGGSNNSNGTLSVRNASNTEIGRWDRNGIYINGGSIYNTTSSTGVSIQGGRMFLSYGDDEVGFVGTNYLASDTSQRGVVFDLQYPDGDYMSWASQQSSGGNYMIKMIYTRNSTSTYDANTMHFGCDVNMRNYQIKNVSWPNGGVTLTLNYVQVLEMNSDGTVARWGPSGKMTFTNGILTDINYYT